MSDSSYMQHAIALGEQGKVTAPPNPWVGSVLVRDGKIIGEGYHISPGTPHAEIIALRAAGDRAHGATCYCTLEPCSHHGKTPPCADALIAAGVSRLVVGVLDPDSNVSGQGIARLRQAGITVTVGIEEAAVERSLLPYLHHRRLNRPFCVLKAAVSVDGKIAASDGTSQWITTPDAREDVHHLRAESQAILIGAGTAIHDKPQLTVRLSGSVTSSQPLRVLLDGKGSVPVGGPLADSSLAPTLIATTQHADKNWIAEWVAVGAEVIVIDEKCSGEASLSVLMSELAERGILQLMIEGGSGVYGAFWKAGFVDRLSIYIGPRLIGSEGLSLLPIGFSTLEKSPILELEQVKHLGQSIRTDYQIRTKQCIPTIFRKPV